MQTQYIHCLTCKHPPAGIVGEGNYETSREKTLNTRAVNIAQCLRSHIRISRTTGEYNAFRRSKLSLAEVHGDHNVQVHLVTAA